MNDQTRTPNRLIHEASPYLLLHAHNPVDWYPWGDEAFARARDEDKPVYLSIGYSTCHWCHVMARESFMDDTVARLLNEHFVAVKVDREERPDIDSIYMAACQAFTGGGGWPLSLFLTSERKPFFAGTYYPKRSRRDAIGFVELLTAIREKWTSDRETLLASADGIVAQLAAQASPRAEADEALLGEAFEQYRRSYDPVYGGFGGAPKFPAPHNLLFLLTHHQKTGDADALRMAEHTLGQMYRGGLFDHIGYGFCRYSTDRRYLVPHFEKMLYDNALLTLAYCKAYAVTRKPQYLDVAEKTAAYVLREMQGADGGFMSAQDADTDGEEGKFYVFTPSEIIGVLGEANGERFNRRYGIDEKGNFEGKSIPNLLPDRDPADDTDELIPVLRAYRAKRHSLRVDDKALTAWNGLMIAALCQLYRASRRAEHLDAAQRAQRFIERRLRRGDTLYVSARADKQGARGFLDDYACYAYALLGLYEATLDADYLREAERMCRKAVADFRDGEGGGYFLYGGASEKLILRPKETYDGAAPSGNGMMAYVLVRLAAITGDAELEALAREQLAFLTGAAREYPSGHAMFLVALSDWLQPPPHIAVVVKDRAELSGLADRLAALGRDATVAIYSGDDGGHTLVGDRTTYYVCRGQVCLPPSNAWQDVVRAL